jgi:hypothetical protein
MPTAKFALPIASYLLAHFFFSACSHSPTIPVAVSATAEKPEKQTSELKSPDQTPAEQKTIPTRFGELVSGSTNDMFRVKLNGYVIYEDMFTFPDDHALVAKGKVGSDEFFIFSRYSGDGCPEENVLIVLNSAFSRQVHTIGNCNSPNIKASPQSLSITYPETKLPNRKQEKWLYQNGKLSKLK